MRNVVNDIKLVVDSMRGDASITADMTTITADNAHITIDQQLVPFYMYGHPLEINNRLLEKNKDRLNKWLKYPLIVLRLDTEEKVKNGIVEYNLNVAILTYTDRKYNAEDRQENVFKPVLYPLYKLFMRKLQESGLFILEEGDDVLPEHTKIDRYYWGNKSNDNNDANMFNDPIDAIELADLKLSSYVKEKIFCYL